jgi:hypothetical protein
MRIALFIIALFSLLFMQAQTGNADYKGPFPPHLADIDGAVTSDCECRHQKTVENTHLLEGYTDKISYLPGEIVKLYAHTLSSKLEVELIHHLSKDTVIRTIKKVCAKKQNYNTCSFKDGCNWSPSLYLQLSDDLPSGFYSLKLSSDKQSFYVSFVIRPTPTSTNKILVLASTNTWQAYNSWGGASFYRFNNENPCGLKFAAFVSFHRPNYVATPVTANAAHLLNAELYVTRWLEQHQYNYDVISDDELDNDSTLLQRYKVLIINSHAEYWTAAMYNHVENYVNHKGNLMYLCGNGMYWKVTKAGDVMECRKYKDLHSQTGEVGGIWRELGRPESALLGVQYDRKGIQTYAPYEVLTPSHWIFNATGVNTGQLFGQTSLTGEAKSTGASGHETDRITSFSPTNTIVLAHGTNPSVPDSTDFGVGGADMIFYEHPAGGGVFAVGSISFGGSLPVDSICSKITQNVLENFLQR